MRVAIVTLFPEMFAALTEYGISRRAAEQQLFSLQAWNPRDFTRDRHQTVDDRPYGGGPGMVMMIEPLEAAVAAAKAWAAENHKPSKVIYLSPQGEVLSQAGVHRLVDDTQEMNLILIAGRYEGLDERFIQQYVDEEWSIGDYVLSGGELPAMVLLDAMIRLLPGALGHADSAAQDSFSEGLLDHPHYTRPENYAGDKVPAVLLSGDHGLIKRWRMEQSLQRTWQRRPELLQALPLTQEQQQLLSAIKKSDT